LSEGRDVDRYWKSNVLSKAKSAERKLKNDKIASKVIEAIKFDTRKEIQVYKQEHHPDPSTKLQLRNKHEREERNKDKA